MEQFISRLSLDSANIIHSLMGMLELIGEESLTDDQAKYLRACRASVDRLHRAIRDVSELGGTKSIELAECAFDIHEVIAGVASVIGALVNSRKLSFDFQQEPDTPVLVIGDRARIEDIAVRLLDHAMRSTHHGGVTLRTRFEANNSGTVSVEISVSDTGPGISPEMREESDSFLDTTDLGLFIVRRLLDRMGGVLNVKSEVGIGSCMRAQLEMPAAIGCPAGPAVETGAGLPLRPMQILVAEDSDDSYELLEAFLMGQGHQLSRATDGAEAIEMFKRSNYDFVLMDIRMPVMDGFSATQAMRDFETQAGARRIPIVVLSAEDTAVQVRIGATVGCTGYLMKPVSKATVLKALHHFAPNPD